MHQITHFTNPPKQNHQKPANEIRKQQKHQRTQQRKCTYRETTQRHAADKNNTNFSLQPTRTTKKTKENI